MLGAITVSEDHVIRFPPSGDQQAYSRIRCCKITTVRPFRLSPDRRDPPSPAGKESNPVPTKRRTSPPSIPQVSPQSRGSSQTHDPCTRRPKHSRSRAPQGVWGIRPPSNKNQCWELSPVSEDHVIRFPPSGDQQAYSRIRCCKITTVRPFRLSPNRRDPPSPAGKESNPVPTKRPTSPPVNPPTQPPSRGSSHTDDPWTRRPNAHRPGGP